MKQFKNLALFWIFVIMGLSAGIYFLNNPIWDNTKSEVMQEVVETHIKPSKQKHVNMVNAVTLQERVYEQEKLLDVIIEFTDWEDLEVNLQEQESILKEINKLEELIKDTPEKFVDTKVKCNHFREKIESLHDEELVLKKLMNKTSISTDMNFGETMGLTSNQISLLMKNVKDIRGKYSIEDEEMIKNVSETVKNVVEEYPVNEVFVLAVMSNETGYFKSGYVQCRNNFGGLEINDEGLVFDNPREGIAAAVKCIRKHVSGKSNIYDINDTYCPEPVHGEQYGWAEDVLSIMNSYKNSI